MFEPNSTVQHVADSWNRRVQKQQEAEEVLYKLKEKVQFVEDRNRLKALVERNAKAKQKALAKQRSRVRLQTKAKQPKPRLGLADKVAHCKLCPTLSEGKATTQEVNTKNRKTLLQQRYQNVPSPSDLQKIAQIHSLLDSLEVTLFVSGVNE